jgi:hypothetical protein
MISFNCFLSSAFWNGGAAEIPYWGTSFARQDVVLVTINYRLGWLGFFSSFGLTASGGAGAQGFLDQQLALKWVSANVARFGGDPNRVTIFGESAGATSVTYHYTTPSSWPLFQQAIIQSSAAFIQTVPLSGLSPLTHEVLSLLFTSQFNCSNIDCLRAIPFDASSGKWNQTRLPIMMAAFSSDGPIKQHPYNALTAGTIHPGNLLAGNVRDEGTLFVVPALRAGAGESVPIPYTSFNVTLPAFPLSFDSYYFGTIIVALEAFFDLIMGSLRNLVGAESVLQYPCSPVGFNLSDGNAHCEYPLSDLVGDMGLRCVTNFTLQRGKGAVYSYIFNHAPTDPPIPGLKVFHASEMPFVFNSTAFFNHTQAEAALAAKMNLAWANFAKSGSPNVAEWSPSISTPVWISTANPWTMQAAPTGCDFWKQRLYPAAFDYSTQQQQPSCVLSFRQCASASSVCCEPGFSCLRHATSSSCGSANEPSPREVYLCAKKN